ncbi:MAG: hypothetical protein J1F05_07090 [Muribaculaceae bacterium]|nr:hypothetical protein [Muribaculaceae bacterium]
MDYKRIYEHGFPYSRRTYFDWIGTEFTYNTKENKLLDIGYLLTKGYDVRSEIHATYREHLSVVEDDVKRTLNILLAELWGGRIDTVESMHKYWTTDRIIDELFSHLLRYYHLPNDISKPHYLKDPMKQTVQDLKKTNGWETVVAEFHGNDALYDTTGKEYIYPGDEDFVHEFNATHKENEQFVLNTVPYPWLGNPLEAKVIVLSQNPGWVEPAGRIIPQMLQREPRIAEEVMGFFRDTYRLESHSFMPEDWNKYLGFSARDAYNAMGDWYWKNRLHFLTDAGVDEETVYDNIAVIQYIPYSSVNYAPLKKGVILPSQIFTRRLIDYIRLNNPETIFIVPRAISLWKEFLGNKWTSLESDGRIITHLPNTYRSQYISPNCIGAEEFEKVVNIFKSCRKNY